MPQAEAFRMVAVEGPETEMMLSSDIAGPRGTARVMRRTIDRAIRLTACTASIGGAELDLIDL